jgi:hypothetical protein
MGARINFVFKDSDVHPAVVLYSHWGETEWQRDLAMAMKHSKPRWMDDSYNTRMIISYLIQDAVLEEIGFGIYAVNGPNFELGDRTVIIDLLHKQVYEYGSDVKVDWDAFINAYAPKVLAETVAG